LRTELNLLEFEIKRSDVKVMAKPNGQKPPVQNAPLRLYGEGLTVDDSPSETIWFIN